MLKPRLVSPKKLSLRYEVSLVDSIIFLKRKCFDFVSLATLSWNNSNMLLLCEVFVLT